MWRIVYNGFCLDSCIDTFLNLLSSNLCCFLNVVIVNIILRLKIYLFLIILQVVTVVDIIHLIWIIAFINDIPVLISFAFCCLLLITTSTLIVFGWRISFKFWLVFFFYPYSFCTSCSFNNRQQSLKRYAFQRSSIISSNILIFPPLVFFAFFPFRGGGRCSSLNVSNFLK